MIRASLHLINPFFKEKNSRFLSIYEYSLNLSKNKAYEFQAYCDKRELFSATMDLSLIGKDHAGIEIELCILGYALNAKLYDKRHWNYDEGRWMTKKEQNKDVYKKYK